jgi:hypothetical protein
VSDPAAAPAPPADAPPPRKGRAGKWILYVGVGLAVLLAAGYLVRNAVARSAAEEAVTRVTGFPLEIGSVDLGLFDSRLEIRDLRLRNPPGFEDPRCLHAPRVVADVEATSAFSKRFHAEEIVLDVAEVVVVTNAKGEMNLDRLAALGEAGKEGPQAKKPAGEKGAAELLWKCDVLRLSLGKVVLLDYSHGRKGKPREEVFDLNIRKEFRNLTSPDQVVRALLHEVVSRTPIKLLKVSAEKLLDGIGDVAGGAAGAVKDAVEGIGDALGGILGGEKKPEAPKKK